MAARKLKVFRTAIGFHDAYVAVPSKKAALAAWGADKDLFAIGAAEQVTDRALMEAPLANPGKVVRLSRGSLAEHLRAAGQPRHKPKASSNEAGTSSGRADTAKETRSKVAPKPKPPPSRRQLNLAERKLEEFDAAAEAELARIRERQAVLERERAAAMARLEKARSRLKSRLDAASERYEDALSRWRADP